MANPLLEFLFRYPSLQNGAAPDVRKLERQLPLGQAEEIESKNDQQPPNNIHPEGPIPRRIDDESKRVLFALVSVAIAGLNTEQIMPLIERARPPNRCGRHRRLMLGRSF